MGYSGHVSFQSFYLEYLNCIECANTSWTRSNRYFETMLALLTFTVSKEKTLEQPTRSPVTLRALDPSVTDLQCLVFFNPRQPSHAQRNHFRANHL